jgi:ATP-dependent Zn protease
MRIALFFLALGVLCTSCITLQVTPQIESTTPMIVPEKLQWEVAYHEAAHAVAMAGVFGPQYVQDVVVRSEVPEEDLGHMEHASIAMHESVTALRGRMVVAFAGREMEIVVNGEPTAGASGDIANANMMAWHLVVTSGLLAEERGSFMIIGNISQSTPEMRARVDMELNSADMYAFAFVKKNQALIRDLASEIMGQKLVDGSRTLSHEKFLAFMKGKKIKVPEMPKEVSEEPSATDGAAVPE